MKDSLQWPEPECDDLRAIVESLISRSDTIHYHGSIEVSSGSNDGQEWLQLIFTSKIPDWPEVQILLWDDFDGEVHVRSRKRKVLGKKLLWLEGVSFLRKPSEIVEAFIYTIQSPPTRSALAPRLEAWVDLER